MNFCDLVSANGNYLISTDTTAPKNKPIQEIRRHLHALHRCLFSLKKPEDFLGETALLYVGSILQGKPHQFVLFVIVQRFERASYEQFRRHSGV